MTTGRPDHALELEVRRADGRFRGACACGWTTPWLRTAGMVHGAHATHLDDAAAAEQAAVELTNGTDG